MKSDYLQRQVNECRTRWDNELQRRVREYEAEYENSVRINQQVEQDIQQYFQHYNIGFIVKKLILYFFAAVIAGAITSYIQYNMAGFVLLAVFAGSFFLMRYPASGMSRERIRQNPSLRFLLNPSLFDIIRTRLNRGKNAEANRQKLEAEKARCEENIRRVRAETETARDDEIMRLKSDFQSGLKREAAMMQNSQYPIQIRQNVMPEVQKMLQNHRVLPGSFNVSARVDPDQVMIRTSTGLERRFSFSSCGLAALNGFLKQIVLTTLTARQIELEIAKYSPGVRTRVDQNDNLSTVST